MSDPDPFAAFESERTVIKPGAGRARANPGAPAAGGAAGGAGFGAPPNTPAGGPAMPAGGGREAPLALDALMTASMNPLVSAAMPLLTTAPRIRHMAQHPNPVGLKDALSEGIRKFEAQARTNGLPNDQVIAARYVLCTLLDESAASTPWGGSGVWSAQSLLVQFHNETWGGEKVFQLMSKLAENIPNNRNLLELLYVCLAFGFEGRYRVLDNGRAQLDSVRQRLAQLLKQGRAEPDKALSPRWEGVPEKGPRLRDGIPLWVVAAFTGLVLMGIYIGFRFALNAYSDPVFSALNALNAKTAVSAPPAPPADKPRLAGFLKPEIDAGLVAVQDLADRSIITIKGDGFFEPGSADIAEKVLPLLGRIETALLPLPGAVLITGHTDNQPIRSLRFPSNWHLSQERALAVRTLLSRQLPPDRLKSEGRADGEPVASNSTPEGRAKNRRVEITLFVQQQSGK